MLYAASTKPVDSSAFAYIPPTLPRMRPTMSRAGSDVPRPPQRDAADFERRLTAMAGSCGVALAAMSYMDIALATEASGLIRRPGVWQRSKRRLMTIQGPYGFSSRSFKRCFAEGLRCTTEAALRYYGIDPRSVALPTPSEGFAQAPALTCGQAVKALERARATMARLEFPDAPPAPTPGCTCRAAFDSASSQLTVYIDWFNGPTETSGVHHCVPLFVATRGRGRRFTFPQNAVNTLPKTSQARGHVPFRYTADGVLERVGVKACRPNAEHVRHPSPSPHIDGCFKSG